MQSFIVLASLVSELAGGVKMTPPPVLNVTKKHLSPLRVNIRFITVYVHCNLFHCVLYSTFSATNMNLFMFMY